MLDFGFKFRVRDTDFHKNVSSHPTEDLKQQGQENLHITDREMIGFGSSL